MSAASTSSTTQTSPRKRRKMTIEEALRWAIRDELPKKRQDRPIRGPIPASIHPMWRAGIFGGPIDNWTREPGMPPAMGDAHPDALVIEQQLEALSDKLQKSAAGSGVCPLDLQPYPIQTELRGKADLEVLISTALHSTPAWLVTCAIRGSMPDVGGGPECEPLRSDNGKITLWRMVHVPCGQGADGEPWFVSHEESATSKGDARDAGLYCRLKWTRTGLDIVEEQLRHAMWHASLVYLVPALQFLTSIEVVSPAAPAAPWLAPAAEVIPPLPNVRSDRRKRLEDRLRPGMRTGQRYTVEEHRSAARRPSRRKAAPVRQLDPASWRPQSERTA